MKKIIIYISILILISVTAISADFCGCIKRHPVNDDITILWNHAGADGYELKVNHYYYDGLETSIVETVNTSYTFSKLPKSSRHFEIQVRAFNNVDGNKVYSSWSVSTDKNYSTFNGQPYGWLIYTTPGGASW